MLAVGVFDDESPQHGATMYMTDPREFPAAERRVARRAHVLFRRRCIDVAAQTDFMFAVLMAIQWLAGVVIASTISPRAWEGRVSHVHPHVWQALILGA